MPFFYDVIVVEKKIPVERESYMVGIHSTVGKRAKRTSDIIVETTNATHVDNWELKLYQLSFI